MKSIYTILFYIWLLITAFVIGMSVGAVITANEDIIFLDNMLHDASKYNNVVMYNNTYYRIVEVNNSEIYNGMWSGK